MSDSARQPVRPEVTLFSGSGHTGDSCVLPMDGSTYSLKATGLNRIASVRVDWPDRGMAKPVVRLYSEVPTQHQDSAAGQGSAFKDFTADTIDTGKWAARSASRATPTTGGEGAHQLLRSPGRADRPGQPRRLQRHARLQPAECGPRPARLTPANKATPRARGACTALATCSYRRRFRRHRLRRPRVFARQLVGPDPSTAGPGRHHRAVSCSGVVVLGTSGRRF